MNYLQVLGTSMATKMAPSYASLFMAKLEMDVLGSYEKHPLIWLRFNDDIFMIWKHSDIFMIWNPSEQDLHDLSPVKRIFVFEHSVTTNFNCTCPAIQRGQGSGFLSEGSS